ncbi:MAG: hypothetical protein GY759_08275 [Chloroflexi bacterium]|nr:hypothetical protein [Chloroflexota bacterium]
MLTKRERVMRTVRFEETDRVPLYDIFDNDDVIEFYAGHKLTVENGARVKGLAIGRALDMTRIPNGPEKPRLRRLENGIVLQQERWTPWIIERPFHDMPTAIEWIKGEIKRTQALVFDRTYADKFQATIRQHLANFAGADPTRREDPTLLVLESGVGLTEMYWWVGMEWFAYLMADEPALIASWLDARTQAELRRVAAIADPEILPIALTYDDIAFKTNLLFSPSWLRQYWLPGLTQLIDAWHARDTICLFHSDGNLWPILDDLVAAGIDGLNPLEQLADMDLGKVRRRYPQLFLAGGIDVSQLLSFGTPDEVHAACAQAIADTGGVGYFMGSTTELIDAVPLQNARAMYEFSRHNK